MDNKQAVKKWGKYNITLKRADELESGDEILCFTNVIHSKVIKVKTYKNYSTKLKLLKFFGDSEEEVCLTPPVLLFYLFTKYLSFF